MAVGVAVTASILSLSGLRRDPIGVAGEQVTTPSGTTSPANASPGTPASAPQASPEQTGVPEPTAEPRSEWSTVFTVEPGPFSRVTGVAEVRGTLFALGRSDRTQPAIWVSQDGTNWTAAAIPAINERLAGTEDASGDLAALVFDVEDAGERLVALAGVGLADGSGYFGTRLYVSGDGGQTWDDVDSTPGTTAAAMFDLERSGNRLIAVGTAIWSSEDGGLSWLEVVDAASIGGTLRAADAQGDLVVATGDGGDGDLTRPPAIALVSGDGIGWERTVLGEDSRARSVAIGSTGRIVIGGHRGEVLSFWTSDDGGDSWETIAEAGECCAVDLAATDAGYVAAGTGVFEGALLSVDGLTWVEVPLEDGLTEISWGPQFGITGSNDSAVLFGPVPAP